MNQSIDSPPGSHLREVCSRPADPSRDSKHLKLLDTLVDRIIQSMNDNSCQPKVRDALKAIQLREKVAKGSEAERIFWNLIDDIKREEFSGLCPVPPSLKSQIKDTIVGLKEVMENGILPLKTITDAFNESRFEQARLTSRRISRLLAAMGFTRAKTHGGCSAIIWDDKLLRPDPFSHPDDPRSEGLGSSVSPASYAPQAHRGPVGGLPADPAGFATDGRSLSSPLVGEDKVEDPAKDGGEGEVCSSVYPASYAPQARMEPAGGLPADPAGRAAHGRSLSSPPVGEDKGEGADTRSQVAPRTARQSSGYQVK